jgi:hypothetical protein
VLGGTQVFTQTLHFLGPEPANTTNPVTVNCPAGHVLTGGGGSVTTDLVTEQGHVQLTQSSPNTTSGTPIGWVVVATLNQANAGGKTVIAYVVCSS